MRVAIYVRVSTQRQAQDQTIEVQLERLRAHLQANGWQLLDEHIFRDDGYSGASLTRPGLDRLRDQAAICAFDRIVLTAPDRLARNYVHQVLLIEELQQHNCQIQFLDRPMSQDPHDQLLLQIRGAVAEYERSLIAERMRRGRLSKYRAGLLLPWSKVPYGYRTDVAHPRDPRGVQLEPAQSAQVAEIFAAYLRDGVGLFAVAKQLFERGVPSPLGKPRWSLATVRNILTNPTYTGQVYALRKQYRPAQVRRSALQPLGRPDQTASASPRDQWIAVATIAAIVSQEQFDQVQAKLAQNKAFARRNNTAHPYLLRALVSCGQCQLACGARMLPGGKYSYYRCQGKASPVQSRRAESCRAPLIPTQALDDLVWQDLCDIIAHPDSIALALQRARGGCWLPQELKARQDNLRRGSLNLEQQLNRLTEAYLAQVIPLVEYQRRRVELEQRVTALNNQLSQLTTQVDQQHELAGLTASVSNFCQRLQRGLASATFEQKRQLVELLIDRVLVSNDDVEIRYVIPTSPSGEYPRFCHLRKAYFDHFRKIF